jgi:hypothetical protein
MWRNRAGYRVVAEKPRRLPVGKRRVAESKYLHVQYRLPQVWTANRRHSSLDEIATGLSDHVWTIKELIERASEACERLVRDRPYIVGPRRLVRLSRLAGMGHIQETANIPIQHKGDFDFDPNCCGKSLGNLRVHPPKIISPLLRLPVPDFGRGWKSSADSRGKTSRLCSCAARPFASHQLEGRKLLAWAPDV